MPIPSTGEIKLNDDINSTLQADTNETDVSLGDNNAIKFTAVSDGDTITGRSMSELRGQSLYAVMPTTEENGALGQSLHMDNVSDNHKSVIVSDVSSDLAEDYNNTKGTISFWVKEHTFDNTNDITYYSSGQSSSAYLWIYRNSGSANGKIVVKLSGNTYVSNEVTLDKRGWYHHVCSINTHDLSDIQKVRYWINGIELTWASVPNLSDGVAVQFGKYQRINDDFWSGSTGQDMTITNFVYVDGYNYLPTKFGELKNGIWVPLGINPVSTQTVYSTGLQAHYKFIDNANDTTSNNRHGTPAAGATHKSNNNGIYKFNGGSTAYITTGYTAGTGTTASVGGWFNISAYQQYSGLIVDSAGTGAHTSLTVGMSGSATPYDRIYVQMGNGSTSWYDETSVKLSDHVKLKEWFHIMVTADTTTVKLYINGVLVHTYTSTVTYSGGHSNATNYYIGGWAGSLNLNGYAGEAYMYNTALTDAQVLQNYNAGKSDYFYGLNGWHINFNNTDTGTLNTTSLGLHLDAGDWDADGTDETSFTGTAWNDKSGNGNNVALVGTPTYSSNNGGYFDFNGSSQYGTIANSASITPSNTAGYTVEAWINRDSNSEQYIFAKVQNASGGYGFLMQWFNTSIGYNVQMYNTSNSAVTAQTSDTLGLNKWEHICASWNGVDKKLRFYVNGHLKVTTAALSGTVSTPSVQATLGAYHAYTGKFDGKIAQVRVYSKHLTNAEVAQNFRATQGHYNVLSLIDISPNTKRVRPNGANLNADDHTKESLEETYPHMIQLGGGFGGNANTLSAHKNRRSQIRGNYSSAFSNVEVNSGKWYWEVEIVASNTYQPYLGVTSNYKHNHANSSNEISVAVNGVDVSPYGVTNFQQVTNFADSGYTMTQGTIFGFKLDLDGGNFYLLKNGSAVFTDTGLPSDNSKYFKALCGFTNDGQGGAGWAETYWNFGQKPFTYSIPSGYKDFSTSNLYPSVSIDPTDLEKASDHFETILYNGTEHNHEINVLDFKPSLLLLKQITGSSQPFQVYDSLRGVQKQLMFSSNDDNYTQDGTSLMGFNSNGFTLGKDNSQRVNDGEEIYQAIAFKAGDTITNITSTCTGVSAAERSVNVTGGFSIIKYTTNASNVVLKHGLNAAPTAIMLKRIDANSDWFFYNTKISGKGRGFVNSGNAFDNSGVPTFSSTDITFQTNDPFSSGSEGIAYIWHDVTGLFKSGSYVGSDNASKGVSIDLGFRPKLVIIKNVDVTKSWYVYDNARDTINHRDLEMYLNNNTASSNGGSSDNLLFQSNGFRVTSADSGVGDPNEYFYLAWAEIPAKYNLGDAIKSNTSKFINHTNTASKYPEKYFKALSYTGNDMSGRDIKLGFDPAMVWTKALGIGFYAMIHDKLRVKDSDYWLIPAETFPDGGSGPEAAQRISSFNPDGYTISGTGNLSNLNNSSRTYVSWCWKGGDVETKNPTYTSAGILSSNLELDYNFANSNSYSATSNQSYTYSGSENFYSYVSSMSHNSSYPSGYGRIPTIARMQDTSDWVTFGNNGNGEANNTIVLTMSQPVKVDGFQVGYIEASYYDYTGRVKLYGSNDNSNYTLIGNYYGPTSPYSAGYSRTQKNTTFTTSAAYTYFKVTFSGNSRGTYQGFYEFIPSVAAGTFSVAQTNTTVNDLTSNNHDGTLTNGPTQGTDAYGNYLELDGSNDFISVPHNTAFNLDTDTTIEMWVYRDSSTNEQTLIHKGTSWSSGNAWFLNYNTSVGYYFYDYDTTSYTQTGTTLFDEGSIRNKWQHVVLVWDASEKRASIYVNGSEPSSYNAQVVGSGTVGNANTDVLNICGANSGTGHPAWNGKLSQVRIYTAVLTKAQIRANYNATKTLFQGTSVATNATSDNLLLNFDPNDFNCYDSSSNATLVNDLSSSNNDGTLVNGTKVRADQEGHYFEFDGSNDYISTTLTANWASVPWSVEMWFNTDTRSDKYIWGMADTSGYGVSVSLRGSGNSYNIFLIGVGNLSGGVYQTGQWYHLVYTSNGTHRKVYVNGKFIDANSSSIDSRANGKPFTIGRYGNYNTAFFDGKLGQIRVYGAELTPEQIKTNYDLTAPQYNPAIINSTVSASDESGFSVTKWSGTGKTNIGVPHGLSKPPELVITKGLTNATSWVVGQNINRLTDDYFTLNTTNAIFTHSASSRFYTGMTNNSIGVGVSSANEMNKLSNDYISYAFRSIPGYQKVGQYVGNGGSQKIITGFKPSFIMLRNFNSGKQFVMTDNSRGSNKQIYANKNNAQNTSSNFVTSFNQDGFSVGSESNVNQNAARFWYLAIA